MAAKTPSVKSNKSNKVRKLPLFLDSKKMSLLALVMVVAIAGGVYFLRRSQALGQICSKTSSSCAPTVLECGALKPTLTQGMYRNGCVAAAQAFYSKGFGLRFVTVDGIYGANTANVTGLYEGTRIHSNELFRPDGKDITKETWHKMVLDCYYTGKPASYCTTHYTFR
jgi:hypothetical protein